MKNLTKLPLYRQQVQTVLKKLKLTPLQPLDKILKDITRRSYSTFVTDQTGKKCFIKIRLSDDPKQKEFFFQSYWLGVLLNKHKPPLYHFTPRLINGENGQPIDFLLYEFIAGKNMGSRIYHDVFKFKKQDLPQIARIHQAIKEISPKWFPPKFRHRDASFFQFLILEDVTFDEKTLRRVYPRAEIDYIRSLAHNQNLFSLLQKNTNTFQHGDFQAPNFVKTPKQKLIILDFDQSSLTAPFYDAVYLYNHAFRKPTLRDALLQAFLPKLHKLSEKKQLLFYFTRFCTAFVWVKLYLRDEKLIQQKPGASVWEQAFQLRAADTKQLLEKIKALSGGN